MGTFHSTNIEKYLGIPHEVVLIFRKIGTARILCSIRHSYSGLLYFGVNVVSANGLE